MTDMQLVYDADDLARIQRAMEKMRGSDLLAGTWQAIGFDIIDKAGTYPEMTWRNYDTGRGYWYERGYGYRGTKDVGKTSAPLGKKWYQTVYSDYLEVGNRAPYADDVIGENQKFLFAIIGWKRLLPTVREMIPAIVAKIEAYALKLWDSTT